MLVIVFGWYIGTSRPENESELYGTYTSWWTVLFTEPIAKEKLILKSDGTFVQEVTLKATTKTDIGKGTWEYNRKSGYVVLEGNFMGVIDIYGELDPDYNKREQGRAYLPASKYYGCVLLGSSEDTLYRKVD